MMLRFTKGSSELVTDNFKAKEFDCKCLNTSCQGTFISSELAYRLDQLRKVIGKPLRLNSAYRCTEHNHSIGGAKTSWHMVGCAVDIACPHGVSFKIFESFVRAIGFTEIIVYEDKNFIHVTQH
jgi:uncharacterized protein YcbK (DUF882 family)